MPAGYTSTITIQTWRKIRGYCEWSSNQSATYVDVATWARVEEQDSYLYALEVYVAIDQPEGTGKANTSASGTLSYDPGANFVEVVRTTTISYRFPRTTAAYTACVRCQVGGSRFGYTGWQTLGWITIPALTTPSAPSNCTHIRTNDNRNTVSWTNNGTNPRSNNLVERSVDGGGYSQIASADGSATSYVDSSTQPDHSYSYRMRAVFTANGYNMYSGYSNNSEITYNTPSVPSEVIAARLTETAVTVNFKNNSVVDTGIEYQRSQNDTSSWLSAVAVSGEDIASFVDDPGGGVWYFRVRTTRGNLKSTWSNPSNAVVTIIAPAAPTLASPLNGSVINKAISPTTLMWSHNPIDGSAQSAAEIRLSTDGGTTWSEVIPIAGDLSAYDHPTDWPVNASVLWQVRTRGAHADFSPWSHASAFTVCQVPQVSIVSPAANTAIIGSMPIEVVWNYSDESGIQMSATLRLLDIQGKRLWSKTFGSETSYNIRATDILPDNGAEYTLSLSVTSTSTFTAQTTRLFATDYLEPAVPAGTATVNKTQASVSLFALAGADADLPETVALSVIRRHADGRQVALADHVPSGTSLVDPYCPTEQDITYIIIAHAETGAVSRQEVPVQIAGEMCCWINFGDKVSAMILDTSHERKTEHDAELFQTAGSDFPLVFYGNAKQMSGSVSGTSLRKPETLVLEGLPLTIGDFDALAAHRGTVVMRLPCWDAFTADVTVTQSAEHHTFEGVSIAWRRVRNHGLAL